MKIALATTTIHVPHALKLMRKCSDDVRFFVAVDEKTPGEAVDFLLALPNTQISGSNPPWKCSEAIGWNTLTRRNIAFLEALKWGADVIYSWDDDNIPVDMNHFPNISRLFETFSHAASSFNFNGVMVSGSGGWFDPGTLLIPSTRHRGFPYSVLRSKTAEQVIDAKIGVAAGLVIGDPDIDATTRMELRPDIGAVHILGQTGVVVDPHTWTVFNSQNTAVIRELMPAWFMMPGVGRHDDIYASLIVQRVARDHGYHVHFGSPFTYQQRNEHDLIKDLRAEIDGMENVSKLAAILDATLLPGRTVIDDVRHIYTTLRLWDLLPSNAIDAALLWLEDVEGVL